MGGEYFPDLTDKLITRSADLQALHSHLVTFFVNANQHCLSSGDERHFSQVDTGDQREATRRTMPCPAASIMFRGTLGDIARTSSG